MKLSFGTITITESSKRLVNEALNSGRVSSGKYVAKFEKQFAKIQGVRKAVAVSSGTDADALALAVLHDFGAKRDDEVILPALSFAATGNAVLHAGFRPVFVDIQRETLNIDVAQIEDAITPKTRAIMPVHLMGKPADMDPINDIAKRHGLFVIEDAAEAHGTLYKGEKVGTLGDMGAFSLYVAHMISTVEGGIVITNNTDFADVLRSLRSHGRGCKCEVCLLNTKSGYCPKRFCGNNKADIRFIFERIGYSSKMNELEAAVGLGSLEEYEVILQKRRDNYAYLRENFARFSPFLLSIEPEAHEQIGPHAFPFIVQEVANFSREDLAAFLEESGIETRTLFASMPTQCAGFKFLGYKIGDFPSAEYIGNNGLHIGLHQDLSKNHLDYFIKCINQFMTKNQSM